MSTSTSHPQSTSRNPNNDTPKEITLSVTAYYFESDSPDGNCFCGAELMATLEWFGFSRAYASIDGSGQIEHTGSTDTDFIYSTQKTVHDNAGRAVRICTDNHKYVTISSAQSHP